MSNATRYSMRPIEEEQVTGGRFQSTIAPKEPKEEDIPVLLEHQVNRYLSDFREALRMGIFDRYSDSYYQAYKERGQHIISSAKHFDDMVSDGIGHSQLVIGRNNPVILKINEGTRLLGPREFTDVLQDYYRELQSPLEGVIGSVRKYGTYYLMDGVYKYREEAAADIEGVCRRFKAAGEISREQLSIRSEVYSTLNENGPIRRMGKRIKSRGSAVFADLGEDERSHLITDFDNVINRMRDSDADENNAHRLLAVTSDLLHHLEYNVGVKSLRVIGKKGKRSLDQMSGGPLHQMEAMTAVLNNAIRDYEELVTIHRDIISATGSSKKEPLLAPKKAGRVTSV